MPLLTSKKKHKTDSSKDAMRVGEDFSQLSYLFLQDKRLGTTGKIGRAHV